MYNYDTHDVNSAMASSTMSNGVLITTRVTRHVTQKTAKSRVLG